MDFPKAGMKRCTVVSSAQMEFANAPMPLRFFEVVEGMKAKGAWRSRRDHRMTVTPGEMEVENIWDDD